LVAPLWMVGVHSWSEVLSGFLIGDAVSASHLWMARVRHPSLPVWLPAGVAFWLAITPVQAPASVTHDMTTRLALTLSGRERLHTRFELLHGARGRERASPFATPTDRSAQPHSRPMQPAAPQRQRSRPSWCVSP